MSRKRNRKRLIGSTETPCQGAEEHMKGVAMSKTLTEHDTRRAMEVLQRVLGRIFAPGPEPGKVGELSEIAGETGKALLAGEYPLVNMFIGMNNVRNPDTAIFLAVAVAAVVEALQQVDRPVVKQ